jgi:hypothetical protein
MASIAEMQEQVFAEVSTPAGKISRAGSAQSIHDLDSSNFEDTPQLTPVDLHQSFVVLTNFEEAVDLASNAEDLDEIFDVENLNFRSSQSCPAESANNRFELPPPVRFFRKRGRNLTTMTTTTTTTTSFERSGYMGSISRANRNRIVGNGLHSA